MKNPRITIVFLFLLSCLTCQSSRFYFHALNVKDGLADNFVRDIVRDSHGYIWLSTINGLSRYDGYRFRNYMPHTSDGRSNDITLVRETADSTLWMLCGRDLYTYSHAKGTWQENGMELLSRLGIKGTLKIFYVDDRRHLWVLTEEGLYHYDYSRHRLHHHYNFTKSPITHIVSRNGTTVVTTSDFTVYEVAEQESRLVPVAQASSLSHSRDSRLYLDNYKNLWIYNSHSLAGTQRILSLSKRQWIQLPEFDQMGNVLINAIAEDNDGYLWVGTGNAGIFLFA